MSKIVTYQGSMDKLVWLKEFKGLDGESEVVVPVSHEAIFICGTRIVESFGSGRHILGESSAFMKTLDGKSAVDLAVYYIKKEGNYNIKWRAQQPLRIDDPVLRLPVEFDIEGVFAIKIIDSKEFLVKLLENTQKASLEEVKEFFKDRMLLHIKEQLLEVLKQEGISIVDAVNKPVAISKSLEFKVRYLFSDFGVSIESFVLKKLALVHAYAPENKGAQCPNCGQKLPENANFCSNCGTKAK